MTINMVEQSVVNLLARDPFLQSLGCTPPRAVLMPFMKSEIEKYICISIFIKREKAILRNLWGACAAAVRSPNERSYYSGLKGIEVILCALVPDGSIDRILRVSVYYGSIGLFLGLGCDDLIKTHPADGVTCGWYWEPDSLGG